MMGPFGATPVCPRCQKAVYAAEQVMGPGRKLYHKPCLVCTTCGKRLDSLQLLEHDQEPYCRSCHVKNFGTRDLRHANLSHRAGSHSGPSSPAKTNPVSMVTKPLQPAPMLPSFPSPEADIIHEYKQASNSLDRPSSPSPRSDSVEAIIIDESEETRGDLESSITSIGTSRQEVDSEPGVGSTSETSDDVATSNGTGRAWHSHSHSLDTLSPLARFPVSTPSALNKLYSPLSSTSTGTPMGTATGTRYGVALTGQSTGGSIARAWGGTTPACGKCGKNVYFAEQVKAAGKTYHKGCLRCAECNTLLDSTRLTEKDGNPLCRRCYGKLHGPQGSGYALLGKAGG